MTTLEKRQLAVTAGGITLGVICFLSGACQLAAPIVATSGAYVIGSDYLDGKKKKQLTEATTDEKE